MFNFLVHVVKVRNASLSAAGTCGFLKNVQEVNTVWQKLVLMNNQANKRSELPLAADVLIFLSFGRLPAAGLLSTEYRGSTDQSLWPIAQHSSSNKWELAWQAWAGPRSCSWCFWSGGRRRWDSTGTPSHARLFDTMVSELMEDLHLFPLGSGSLQSQWKSFHLVPLS